MITTTTGSLENIADGVKFTLSGDAAGGQQGLSFGNGLDPDNPILLDDFTGRDEIILNFQSTANPSNTFVTGTAGSPLRLEWGEVRGWWSIGFQTTGGNIIRPTGPTYQIRSTEFNGTLTYVGSSISGIVFTSVRGFFNGSGFARIVPESLSGQYFCFCAGTRIATPDGSVEVETLKAGDKVLRADGGETTVEWLGIQHIDVPLEHPLKVNPVCISAGSLGENLPERDLWLSKDHAIALDGLLINAGVLVNDTSIYQADDMPKEGFTYYHVETKTHELILAEGLACESYLDMPSRDGFDNGNERATAPPIQEMSMPRISSSRLLPPHIRAALRIDKAA